MKQRVSRDAAHTFPAFTRKYSRGGFPFSWWFTARTCLGRCRSHNGESCRRRSPADTVITGWHLPGRDHNDNGRFAGKTSSYTLAVCTGYASTAVLSCTVSFGRINRLPLPPPSLSPPSPRAATLFRPNRRVTLLWLFVTAGDRDATSYRRLGCITLDWSRQRTTRAMQLCPPIEKRLRFFVDSRVRR